MCPGSDLLTALNSATANATAASDYYAVQSTFTALNGMLNAVMNTAVDRLFHGKENNLSVPALGVSDIDRNLLAQRYVLLLSFAAEKRSCLSHRIRRPGNSREASDHAFAGLAVWSMPTVVRGVKAWPFKLTSPP